MEDIRIIDLFWQRNQEAIRQAKERYGGYCYAIALNILQDREDAAECENDTYLRAWESMPPDRPCRLRVYMGTITRRLALDRWRKAHADKRGGGQVTLSLAELEECIPAGSNVEQTVESGETARAISAFLRTLPPAESDLFLRRYWYLDSIQQIARRYGFSESKVKMTLKRTRDKLRVCLEKEGILYET
ncbi:MAG: sigma-70 family RNA polymerase sigma factor [Ruminococcaceae bacterium]|nr:sigma-70 family RNA polymerase sigma factor [Oscillospiraceae bacterium]